MDVLQILKALGDETRLRILNLLTQQELCVCEIERILEINQSNASRHLNKLSVAGLIQYEKRALYVYYKINNSLMEQFPFLKEFLMKELKALGKCRLDLKRLEIYKSSGLSCEDLKAGKGCFSCPKVENCD